MDLSNLANIGEFISGIAVIFSLIYLALQIRYNAKTVRGQTLQQNTDFWGDLFLQLAHPEFARIFGIGIQGRADISPMNYTQFVCLARSMFMGFENQYFQYQSGILDPDSYSGYEKMIAAQILAYRGFRIYWEQNRSYHSPVFIDHFDNLLARTPEVAGAPELEKWIEIASRLKAEQS